MITLYLLCVGSPEAAPDIPAALPDFSAIGDQTAFTGARGGVAISGVAVDAPYPDESARDACADNLFWPKAAEVVDAHTRHMALAAKHPDEGFEARRAEMLAVLDVALALAGTLKATAFYCPAGACVAPVTRLAAARQAIAKGDEGWLEWTPEPFISINAVAQRAAPSGKADTSFLTTGAAPFFGHEVAVRMTGRAGLAHAVTLFALRHLMAHGPIFKDGDLIPVPDGPTLTVRAEDGLLLLREEAQPPAPEPDPQPEPKPTKPLQQRGAKPKIWMNMWNWDPRFNQRGTFEPHVKVTRETWDQYKDGNLEDDSALPPRFNHDSRKPKRLPDVFSAASFLVVSENAKSVLETFDLGRSSFAPFEIYCKDGETPIGGAYFIFNLREKKAGVVIREPEFKPPRQGKDKRRTFNFFGPWENATPVRPTASEGADVWLDSQMYRQAEFFSDRIYRACRKEKLRGFSFLKTVVEDA